MADNSPAKDRAPGATAHAIITTKTGMANPSKALQVRFFMLPSVPRLLEWQPFGTAKEGNY